MYDIAVFVSAFLLFIGGVHYAYVAWIGKSSPVLATWILMTVVMGLSFWMYWGSPRMSWTGNIAVTLGVVNVLMVLVGVIASGLRYGTLRLTFSNVQKWCMASGGVIVALWFVTDQPLLAYILVQCVGLVGYGATVLRLKSVTSSTEPLFLWVVVLIACIIAIYPAVVTNDVYSWIYLGRAIPSTAYMIHVITGIKRKMK